MSLAVCKLNICERSSLNLKKGIDALERFLLDVSAYFMGVSIQFSSLKNFLPDVYLKKNYGVYRLITVMLEI